MFYPFLSNGLFCLLSSNIRGVCLVFFLFFLPCIIEIPVFNANIVDPDQTPRSAASDLGPRRLPMSLLRETRHKWDKRKGVGLNPARIHKLLSLLVYTRRTLDWVLIEARGDRHWRQTYMGNPGHKCVYLNTFTAAFLCLGCLVPLKSRLTEFTNI